MFLLFIPILILFLIFQLAASLREERGDPRASIRVRELEAEWSAATSGHPSPTIAHPGGLGRQDQQASPVSASRGAADWRASVLLSALAWGALVVLVTESLSLAHRLDSSAIAIAWALVLVGLLGLLVQMYLKARSRLSAPSGWLAEVRRGFAAQDPLTWAMLGVFAVQVVFLLAVALAFAPNTYESMIYQLTRPLHWLQNGSLASFASNNVREDYFPPFAEYVFMHLIALTGGDRYVNLVQWGAFLLSAVGVSAVASEFGAKPRTQLAAAILSAAIPMGVLQATAARNDLILSLWLLTFTYFGLRWGRRSFSWPLAAGAGLSLGLAVLTKPSSFPYALPLALWIGILAVRTAGFRLVIIRGTFLLLLALTLNIGHFGRNSVFYSDPVGIHARVGSDLMSPAIFTSNLLRNSAMHVPADCDRPLTFLNSPGKLLLSGLKRLHALTGQDPTDTRTTWGNVNIFDGSLGCSYDEHYAGNALHALLIFLAALTLPFLRSVNAPTKWFALALVAGFALLSLTLRWQVWASHLQLPLFVLWMPVVALVLSRVQRPDLARIVALLALLLSFLWIYNNRPRPLSALINGNMLPREEQYFFFASTDFVYPQYRAAAQLIAETGCDRVGLNITSLAFEYPIWTLLHDYGFGGTIQHVDVNTELDVYEDPAFVPCAIISDDTSPDYSAAMSEHPFGVFNVYLDQAPGAP